MLNTYAAQPLREPCLVAVANRFEAIAAGRVSERDSAVFREFLRAVAPTVRLMSLLTPSMTAASLDELQGVVCATRPASCPWY